eukprot:jgi/Botrbrau1/5441/Bobra.182_1s0043.1
MHGGDGPRSPSHALTNLISRSSDAEERLMDEPRDASGEQMQVSVPSPVHRSTAGVRPLSDTWGWRGWRPLHGPNPHFYNGSGASMTGKRSQPLRLLSWAREWDRARASGDGHPIHPDFSPAYGFFCGGVLPQHAASDSSARPLSVFDPGYSYTSGTQTGPPSATPGFPPATPAFSLLMSPLPPTPGRWRTARFLHQSSLTS